MEAKQKAEELINKFYQKVADGSHPEENAKECALIAVEEQISQLEIMASKFIDADLPSAHNYTMGKVWQLRSVKDHLINR